MLVLTRKVEQQIVIGGKVTITILRVKGQSVQIGIEAGPEIRVLRGELAATLDKTNEGEPSDGPAANDPIPRSAGSKHRGPRSSSRDFRSGPIGSEAESVRRVAPWSPGHLTCST